MGDALGIDTEHVLEAVSASAAYRTSSLSQPLSGADDAGDETLGDTIGTSEAGFAVAEDRAVLDRMLEGLTARDRAVLRLRFDEDLTQAQIGARIGVSQMQVSRIIRQSIARLRTAAEDASR
jgi:RNA polymerase sigma-B factor